MSDGGSVVFVPLGPLYGWFCAECGDTRMGFSSKAESRQDASSHAVESHWDCGYGSLSVEWTDDDEDA